MKIPDNSFVTSLEYTSIDLARVVWKNLDNGEIEVIEYQEQSDRTQLGVILRQQMEIDNAPEAERFGALRALAKARL